MNGITSHVLDTSIGKPASDMEIVLEIADNDDGWREIGRGVTDQDGRCPGLTGDSFESGRYRINFLVADYFRSQMVDAFYPVIRIEFTVADKTQHYHVPLLLNPFGYSTYRGS